MRRVVSCAAMLVAAGCASFDGSGLIAGRSGAAEVEAQMGKPVLSLPLPNGDTALYFSRLPEGRAVYVVEVSRDGVVKSVEQRLVRANLRRLTAGTSTRSHVLALFGPPGREGRIERQARNWWEYKYVDFDLRRVFWVQFSDDGVVREVLDMTDWERDDLCTPPFA